MNWFTASGWCVRPDPSRNAAVPRAGPRLRNVSPNLSLNVDLRCAGLGPRSAPPVKLFRRPLPLTLKILALSLLQIVAVSASADDAGSLQMFYCIHSEHDCVSPSAAVPSNHAKALAVAEKAFSSKDDFVGFTDVHETTLQFYVEEVDSVWVDMPVPERKGSYGMHTSRAKALQIISRLSPPLSRYRSELHLEFKEWD
jgi:hypothetical protein